MMQTMESPQGKRAPILAVLDLQYVTVSGTVIRHMPSKSQNVGVVEIIK
jgi:hypothetical protein